MATIRMGDTTEEVFPVALGCWALSGHGYGPVQKSQAMATIHAALDHGINLFDTADVYNFGQSERILGDALAGRRDKSIIASKFGVTWNTDGETHKDISAPRVRRALEASLKRLNTDWIDLYQIHWPDGQTPIEEPLSELVKFRDEGKVRAIGISNFDRGDLRAACQFADIQCYQGGYSILAPENEDVLRLAKDQGLSTLVYGVLARGLLTGKFRDSAMNFPDGDTRKTDPWFAGEPLIRANHIARILEQRGEEFSMGAGAMAIKWALMKSWVDVVILGAKSVQQVAQNASALSQKIPADIWSELEKAWQK